jgi:hypothetical protein
LTAVNGVIHQCAADVRFYLFPLLKYLQWFENFIHAGHIPGFSKGGHPTRPTSTTYALRLRATTDTLRVDHSPRRNEIIQLIKIDVIAFYLFPRSLLRMRQTVRFWPNLKPRRLSFGSLSKVNISFSWLPVTQRQWLALSMKKNNH